MAVERIAELRKLALEQLLAYRVNCAALRNGRPEGRAARGWIRVITRARRILLEEEPEKARFMARLFGLDHPIPQRKTARERLLLLARELHCSEATLYNWRAEIVELVLFGGVEAGLIRPFQDRKGGRKRKKTL
ncbi:MAG: hypothetical protein Q4C13_01765 [Clostridia bacterium]|nr:hypothetical protein [Clostridia bacterium]